MTSFLCPSRECWREGEQWGAQPESLSSACSWFHGLRRWFAFLGQQPAIGKQETSRQASLLHTKWHEQACGHNCAHGALRSHCLSLKTQPPTPPAHSPTNAPHLSFAHVCSALPGDTLFPMEGRLYHLACFGVYKCQDRLREELYLPPEICSSEPPFPFLLWVLSEAESPLHHLLDLDRMINLASGAQIVGNTDPSP